MRRPNSPLKGLRLVDKLRPYVEAYPFTVLTDNWSLTWLKNLKDPTGRLGRWAMKLLAHNITIIQRLGALHKISDALSRAYENQVCSLSDFSTSDPWYLNQIFLIQAKPEKYPDWHLQNAKLYHHRPNSWKIVLRKEIRFEALQQSHNTP